ncbi:ribbon-helix-helix protein, CopG family [Nocardia alba]|uniref:Ribbon-helix-helix CopG family protein n=1 Tax=Nocardia alba TaxID=225051 RepID=A0A4V2PC36_9NOCA|nr:ribbon-helix-helix protein, CopG family [Nocardia alba]TCJ99765.1 ribbon-helix-helix CopG family protein [Nocardia alba]
MTTIAVHLPEDVAEQLAAAAAATGVSVNVAMVQAAQEWIHANAQRARERARMLDVLAEDPQLRALLGDD